MIWNQEYESMKREDLRELQLRRVQWIVKWVHQRVPAYKKKLEKEGVKPSDIKALQDIEKLPFTTKNDLMEDYPFGFFALPMNKVVRIHSTSGTTGSPVVVGYSRGDLNTWAEVTARVAAGGGVTDDDIVQISFGYGLFTGGFGMHYGVERVGATVVPVSAGNTERQIMIMQNMKTTGLVCTPTYALHVSEVAVKMGVDLKSMPLRVALFGAEPWSEGMRKEIEERMGVLATDNYGLSEIIGPGVAFECEHKNGLHINEDHFLPEIIDPETGEQLPIGETGELVFSTLTKEAFPMIRYRTKDLTAFIDEPCDCGRTLIRMERVKGRTDDMLIIRGVNVFPSQIEHVLTEIEGVEPQYQIVLTREETMDQIEVWVEVSQAVFPDAMRKLVEFEREIENRLYNVLGLHAKVKLVEPNSIERTAGKAKRVIDRRGG